MSGALSVAGFGGGNDFLSLLQHAAWRGIPFSVIAAEVHAGRKTAVHDYPFSDGVWVEDLGQAPRRYSFTGYLVGDGAPVLRDLLMAAAEKQGSGLLIHPSVGAVNVSLITCGTAERRERLRVIEVALEFLEQREGVSFPAAVIGTVIEVARNAGLALGAVSSDFNVRTFPAAAHGSQVTEEAARVVRRFGSQCTAFAGDPTAIVKAVAGLPGNNGRYAGGKTATPLPEDTTVASVIEQVTAARQGVVVAVAGSAAAAATLGPGTDLVGSLAALTEAVRSTMTDPADQLRTLSGLASFSYTDTLGTAGLGPIIATARDLTATAARRAAVISMAQAAKIYTPSSYEDAAEVRETIAAALDVEVTAAADAGEDDTFQALKALHASVVQDLTERGASLAHMVTVDFKQPLPALFVAQLLYQDATRADELIRRVDPPHPAFMPVEMQVLSA